MTRRVTQIASAFLILGSVVLGKLTRKLLLALVVFSVVTSAGVGAVAAHGTTTTGTTAECRIHHSGVRQLIARLPASHSSVGTTYLAAGIQSAYTTTSTPYFHGYINFGTSASPNPWMTTVPSRFSRGEFALGSTWYSQIAPTFNSYGLPFHRAVFLVHWSDGHQTWAYSNWVFC